MTDETYDLIYKLVIIGDSGVGKTGIMNRYLHSTFNEHSKSTIGVEFGTKKTIIDNSVIRAQIWDTAGQEKYKSITSAYYKGAKAAIIVYDITNKLSFDNIDKWIGDIKANADKNIILLICGNKSDLGEKRVISLDEALAKSSNNNLIFFETSAKTGYNIDEVFEFISASVYKEYKQMINEENEDTINIDKNVNVLNDNKNKDKKTCC